MAYIKLPIALWYDTRDIYFSSVLGDKVTLSLKWDANGVLTTLMFPSIPKRHNTFCK